MASYSGVPSEFGEEAAGYGRLVSQDDSEVSLQLANALRKMDSLIGDYSPHPGRSPLPQDPLAVSIVTQCDTLMALVKELEEKVGGGGVGVGMEQVREWIAPETRQYLSSWLTGNSMDQVEQLQRQMVIMAAESAGREDRMTKEMSILKQRLREAESKSVSLTPQLQTSRESGETNHTTIDISPISRQQNIWPTVNHTDRGVGNRGSTHSDTVVMTGVLQRNNGQRRSFKKSFSRKFSRKKSTGEGGDLPRNHSSPVISLRESAFLMWDSNQLGEWLEAIGLEMYRQLIESKVPSGDRLITMTRRPDNAHLVSVGIVNTLHCKKLRLAVEEAISDTPTPLEGLGHNWVSEWLRLVGLPGYIRTFVEGRIDARMLNVISMSDLDLLEVNDPFHQLSLKRAIQAFRMCAYNSNYLKDQAAASQGSQRLLHWTAEDVKNWIWSVNLDEYVTALDNIGLHGALMLLEPRFTSESLARILGIQNSQVLICKHLTKSFMDLLGPVATQKKMDAMASKNFQCILPTADRGKGKGRAKPRRSKEEENMMLCPLSEYPPADPTKLPLRPISSLPPPPPPSSSTPVITRHNTVN